MEVGNAQSLDHQLEFTTLEDLERAKAGVADFKHTFKWNWLEGRKILRNSKMAPAIQSMFLGLKPMISFLDKEIEEVKKVKLPDKFKLEDNHLYDLDLVRKVINENQEYFDDFSEYKGGIEEYVRDLLARKPYTNQTERDIIRVGLLYGFPKDAVLSYAQNIQNYTRNVQDFIFMRIFALDPSRHMPAQEKEIILHFAHTDETGKVHLEANYLEDFLDQHSDEVRLYLKQEGYSKEEIAFMVENRPIDTHGFQFGTGVPTEAASSFLKKLDELFEKSGMNQFLSRSRFLLSW